MAPLSRWVRWADAIAAGLMIIGLWMVVTERARGGVLNVIVPPTTPASALLYGAAALLLVRHVAVASPSALTRLRAGLGRFADAPVWGPAWRTFVATRLVVFAVAFFAVATIRLPDQAHPPRHVLMSLPDRFDAGWYGGIAMNGYTWDQSFRQQANIAFFPAMPLLMRGVGALFGAGEAGLPQHRRLFRLQWAGVLVSLTAFLFALVYLVKLGGELLGLDRAGDAAWLLACYPFAFAFSAPYTESLFLVASVGMAYHARRSAWLAAGGWGLVAGLTRPNGFLIALPLGILALQQIWQARRDRGGGWLRRGVAPLVAAVMPVAGMLIFTVYLFTLTGVWFAWRQSHMAWGRTFEGMTPLTTLWHRLQADGLMTVSQQFPFDTLNALGFVFALVMIRAVHRTMGWPWALYVLVSITTPLLAGGVLSMGRLTSTLFPLFLALAAVLPSRAVPHWAAALAMGQGLAAALFFTSRQLY